MTDNTPSTQASNRQRASFDGLSECQECQRVFEPEGAWQTACWTCIDNGMNHQDEGED